VVVAIIALLAAILFPAFSRVREMARQTSCLSNLKQMGLGVLQYVQDNDETLPYDTCGYGPLTTVCTAGTGYYSGTSAASPVTPYDPWTETVAPFWFEEIQTYVKDSNLYQEPSSQNFSTAVPQNDLVGYFSNGAVWANSSAGGVMPRTESTLGSYASQTITVYDNLNATNSSYGNSRYLYYRPYWSGTKWNDNGAFSPSTLAAKTGPHNDMINVLYVDGHAKAIKNVALQTGIMPSDAAQDPGTAPFPS